MANSTSTAETESEMQNVEAPQTEMVTPPVESDGMSEDASQPQASSEDDIEQLKAALKEAKADAAKRRHQAKQFETKAKELDDLKAQLEAEKLSESEKLQKKLADLQNERDIASKELQDYKTNTEIRLQALQLGLPKEAAQKVARLIDWSEIEYENGTPTNVEDLLKNLLEEMPYLKPAQSKPTPTSGGATNPSRSTTTSQGTAADYINRLAQGKLSNDEYNALSNDMKRQILLAMTKR